MQALSCGSDSEPSEPQVLLEQQVRLVLQVQQVYVQVLLEQQEPLAAGAAGATGSYWQQVHVTGATGQVLLSCNSSAEPQQALQVQLELEQ